MEQAIAQWGPAGFVLVTMVGALIAIVKWFMKHIDILTNNNRDLIQDHLSHTNSVLEENSAVIRDLRQAIHSWCAQCERKRGR